MPDSSKPSSSTTLYEQIAAHYQHAIEQGILTTGQRMPSVRVLMARHNISLSTALQALRHLEEEGYLQARERVGYFVRPRTSTVSVLDNIHDPDLRRPVPAQHALPHAVYKGIHERISSLINHGRSAPHEIDFSLAIPAPELFEQHRLNELGVRVLREYPDVLTRRSRIAPEFQAAMARHALSVGVQVQPDSILPTLGNAEAVSLALQALTQVGDVVALESPTFYGLLQLAEVHGLRTIEIPCSSLTGLSLDALALAVQQEPRLKAVIVTPSLQMPTGSIMPDAHKQALVQFCTQHDLALIEDDIYRELIDSPQPVRPLKAWDTTGQVIYCASLNKTLAPGLRMGWMNAGRWHARMKMLKYARSRNLSVWSQLLSAQSISSGHYPRHLQRLRRALRENMQHCIQAIATHFPHNTRLTVPSGGLCLWIELPDPINGTTLFHQALEHRILISPGELFSNTARYNRFIRLCCNQPFTPHVEQAFATLGRLAREQNCST